MRVAVVSSRFPPMAGGVADYTLEWSRAMQALDNVDVIVVSGPGAESADGLTVETSQQNWSLRGLDALEATLRRVQPDVVVFQYVPHAYSRRGGGLPVALLLARVSRRLKVPLVVNGHELYGRWPEARHRAPWFLAQRLAVGVLVMSSSAFVVTVQSRRDRLPAALRERVVVIPIGPTIRPAEAPTDWRYELGLKDSTVALSTLGLGHTSQDSGALSRLLHHLDAAAVDCRLLVAGHLHVPHPNAVHLGYVTPVRAAQLLANADLFVLPLAGGVSGRRSSVVSALACGAAVVTTSGRETDPGLFAGGGVRTVPEGDDAAFADAVLSLVVDPDARRELRESGQQLFREHFDWPVVAARWHHLLHRVIDA